MGICLKLFCLIILHVQLLGELAFIREMKPHVTMINLSPLYRNQNYLLSMYD